MQTQVVESTILRAIYSKRQLFERMVEFWTDHFNTDINTVGILKLADVRDVLRAERADDVPADALHAGVEPGDDEPAQHAAELARRRPTRTSRAK